MVGGTQAVLAQNPAHTNLQLVPPVQLAVERDRLFAPVLKVKFQMVLQVLTNTGQLMLDHNASLLQYPTLANSGELQQMGRADGAGRRCSRQFPGNRHPHPPG